jgi:hypothetical protein
MRVTGSTSSPTISGAHDTTFVEHCSADNDGFKFKSSSSGSFVDVAAITKHGMFLYDGSLREDWDQLSGSSVTCNVNNGGAFSVSMPGNLTIAFSGAVSGMSNGFVLKVHGYTGYTVTWPGSVRWAGGTAPDAPASGGANIYAFWTVDGGTTWYGVLSSEAT